ncbi:hypothetical protein EMGBS4_17900 [Acidimicrobiaceae bacterium]|nr:hypothetical protein EMGBS4_17900 [Acidimicrobiaceae bacterium]
MHYPIRIIIVAWQALIMLIACNQKLRKVVSINLVVFCVLFLILEIPFRLLTSSQSSSQFQYIELFRNSRSDGPGLGLIPKRRALRAAYEPQLINLRWPKIVF